VGNGVARIGDVVEDEDFGGPPGWLSRARAVRIDWLAAVCGPGLNFASDGRILEEQMSFALASQECSPGI